MALSDLHPEKKVASRIDFDFIRISSYSYNHPITPSQWITLWLGNPTNQRFWWGNLDLVEKIKPSFMSATNPINHKNQAFRWFWFKTCSYQDPPRSQNSLKRMVLLKWSVKEFKKEAAMKLLLFYHKIEFKYRLTWLKCLTSGFVFWCIYIGVDLRRPKSNCCSNHWDDFHQILFCLWNLDSEANIVPLTNCLPLFCVILTERCLRLHHFGRSCWYLGRTGWPTCTCCFGFQLFHDWKVHLLFEGQKNTKKI